MGAAAVGDILGTAALLKDLILSNNFIYEDGAKALVKLLPTNFKSSLSYVCLSNNRFKFYFASS